MTDLAERNRHVGELACFVGAGCYNHYVPAAVGALMQRGEFLTSYTPYQAEMSQGTLQFLFEFQSLTCDLLGLEIANALLSTMARAGRPKPSSWRSASPVVTA